MCRAVRKCLPEGRLPRVRRTLSLQQRAALRKASRRQQLRALRLTSQKKKGRVSKKRVSFGVCEELLFQRRRVFDRCPDDEGWALGMRLEHFHRRVRPVISRPVKYTLSDVPFVDRAARKVLLRPTLPPSPIVTRSAARTTSSPPQPPPPPASEARPPPPFFVSRLLTRTLQGLA